MQTNINQLKYIINKNNVKSIADKPKAKSRRDFDFNKYKLRHIAIKLLYLGWNYCGFAAQEDTQQTIEAQLFDALMKTRLIRSRQTSNYHRCGRTDKGVSAFSQVISIDVRTNLKNGKGVVTPEDYVFKECKDEENDIQSEEINYTLILNNVLPENIRVICWAAVEVGFSARFDCKSRTYKYLFPKSDLDIEKMKIGLNYLLGEHDFRNLCKMDVNNGVVNYKRNILSVDLRQYSTENNSIHFSNDSKKQLNESYSMCCLTISGTAFLWHQIRCIVAILFLIGQHKEEPQIVIDLLNVNKNPNKPQYCMSADFPLILFDCSFSESDVKDWIFDTKAMEQLIRHLQCLWTKQMVKTDIIKSMINCLIEKLEFETNSKEILDISYQIEPLCMGSKNKVYKPLLQRPFCG